MGLPTTTLNHSLGHAVASSSHQKTMKSYSECLRLQAKAAWETWYMCSCTAWDTIETIGRWYYSAFLGDTAVRRYEAIGKRIGFLLVLAIALGMIARIWWQAKEVLPILNAHKLLIDGHKK